MLGPHSRPKARPVCGPRRSVDGSNPGKPCSSVARVMGRISDGSSTASFARRVKRTVLSPASSSVPLCGTVDNHGGHLEEPPQWTSKSPRSAGRCSRCTKNRPQETWDHPCAWSDLIVEVWNARSRLLVLTMDAELWGCLYFCSSTGCGTNVALGARLPVRCAAAPAITTSTIPAPWTTDGIW